LLFKGGALIKDGHALDAQSIWIVFIPILGIIIGLLKGRFLFSKSCEKNIERIKALGGPRIWQCFRPGMLIFLAVIISTGAWMSRAAAGNWTFMCLVGFLDISIANALLSSSIVFWRRKAFSTSGDSGNAHKKEKLMSKIVAYKACAQTVEIAIPAQKINLDNKPLPWLNMRIWFTLMGSSLCWVATEVDMPFKIFDIFVKKNNFLSLTKHAADTIFAHDFEDGGK